MDQATAAWESMLTDANGNEPMIATHGTVRGNAVVALRTIVLLILAALAILVLLPAALVAQAAFAG